VTADKHRPNILDVAHRAGVSAATVSRVLNRTTPVSAAIRARVMASVAEMGYTASPRSSPATRQALIALLIPDILNPYFAEVVRGVQEEIGPDEFLPILLDTVESPQRERQFLRMLAGQTVQGVIVLGSRILANEEIATLRGTLHAPLVFVNRLVRLPNVACIRVDYQAATHRATSHLLDLHHTRIAYLPGPSDSEASHARRCGVEAALSGAGLSLPAEFCPAGFPNVDGGFQAMSALLALPAGERPTAVIAYNDLMALGSLHAVRAHGLRVPDDVSVVGFDDIAMAAHANPPLTTLSQPKYHLGRLAMKTLRRMLQGEAPPDESYTLVESPLVVRASTAPAPRGAAR
jgi:DNA-binding LacI/PurR family transcriptional regulator